jgi:hypothetical protein
LDLQRLLNMAAGTFTNNYNQTISVGDNTCALVKQASVSQLGTGWQANSCSTDPVVAGTTLYFFNPLYNINLTWTVTAITATSSVPALATNCTSDLMCLYPVQDILFIATCVFAMLFGFSTGKSQ